MSWPSCARASKLWSSSSHSCRLTRQRTDSVSPAPPTAPSEQSERAEGFTIRQGDDNSVRVRGLLHFDARHYTDDSGSGSDDGWVLRRARPILQARLTDVAEVGFAPEFAGGRTTILDAFVTLHAAPSLSITAGKFKVPVGLERIMSAADLRFIERALPTSLVPNRDLGVQLHGDLAHDVLSYSIGYFNGVSDGGSGESGPTPGLANENAGDWAARLFAQPFVRGDNPALRGLGFGVAATYAQSTGSATAPALPVYRSPGQQIFFNYRNDAFADGERLRLTAHFYYPCGPFGVLGEAVQSSQRIRRSGSTGRQDVHNAAWQLQLGWLITGEQQKFRGAIEPIAPFSLDANTWGAFELVARYHELDVDDDAFAGGVDSLADPASAASKASAFGVGINWYLNQYLKWSLDYERTSYEGGAPGGADREDEQFLAGRFAVSF